MSATTKSLQELAKVARLKRTAWHEDFGVPISQTYAEFLDAIGELIEVCESPNSPPQIVSAPPSAEAYAREYASSSNAALQEELQYVLEDWNMLVKASGSPTNGAAIGYVAKMRRDLEAAESKVKDAANEIHMLERAAESHKYTVPDLVAERDGLREALRAFRASHCGTIGLICDKCKLADQLAKVPGAE